MLKKAKSIKDILAIQEKIRRLESEIESKKGKLKYYDDKVKYSTLHVNLSESIKVEIVNNKFTNRIASAFGNGFQSFLSFIVVLVNLWPFLFLILFIWISRKWIFKKLRKK